MYRLFLIAYLLLNGNLILAQEFQNGTSGERIGKASTVVNASLSNHTNDVSVAIIDRTPTSTRPCALINDKSIAEWCVASDVSFRRYRKEESQREAGKRDRRSIWIVEKCTQRRGSNMLVYDLVGKDVLASLAYRNIYVLPVLAFIKSSPPNLSPLRSLCPRYVRLKDGRNTGIVIGLNGIPPYTNNVTGSDKITLTIDKKTRRHNLLDSSVFTSTDDRDNGLQSGLYCFDGYRFRFIAKSGHCTKNNRENEEGSHSIRLTSDYVR